MEILCRIDPATTKPVVFVTDSIHNGKIQAWNGEGKAEYVPLDFYHMTGPLSAADERILCERFVKQANVTGVVKIRHRLPRTSRPLPNLLSMVAHAPDDVASNATIMTTPVAPPRKRRGPSAKVAVKGAKRGPKPRMALVDASVSQATPTDVMNAIAALNKEFSERLSAMASMLGPKQ